MHAPPARPGTIESGRWHVSLDGHEFFEIVNNYLNERDRILVNDAFVIARREHGDQRRQSGELFFTHPLTVAFYLAEYRLGAPALIAALLHDVAEDTLVSVDQINEQFGPTVYRLVDSVTKLKEVAAGVSKGRHLPAQEIQDASLHKMFDAMTNDVRVVLIKLFDRLHNMRTIQALPEKKQRQKANETLIVYAPLANRLGIWRLKSELEALSLQVIDNDAYRVIKQVLDRQFHKQQADYASVAGQIISTLTKEGMAVVNVLPNPENIYSVYRLMETSSLPYDAVESPRRVVVLLEDVPSCYLALGYVHQRWRPVPGQFDDYIAVPRENLYRAIHTTVIYSDGKPLKIRLRSVAMNEVSEIGILAKWLYSGTPMWTDEIAERVNALFSNISENINIDPQDMSTGVKSVVEDVFRKQIMVYTPRGDIIELPQGATPIDFAYAIHSEVGNQCQTAYVNERPYPLSKPLQDGDRVRVVKSGWARPHRTWLDEDLGFLTTGRARSQVRRWFRRLPELLAMTEGRKILRTELELLGLDDYSAEEVATLFDIEQTDELYYLLGHAELLPTIVATQVLTQEWHQEPLRDIGSVVQNKAGKEFVITYGRGRSLRLCQACNARPGETIIGFLRSDRGVTVHRIGCYTLRPDPMFARTIKLDWGKEGEHLVRQVTVQIDVYDRAGLLFEIAELLRDENVNITAINTRANEVDGTMRVVLEIDIASPRKLVRILHQAQGLVNVYDVRRLRTREQASET
jgi:RelA/SpoT family (p)ppGpp synthetase